MFVKYNHVNNMNDFMRKCTYRKKELIKPEYFLNNDSSFSAPDYIYIYIYIYIIYIYIYIG